MKTYLIVAALICVITLAGGFWFYTNQNLLTQNQDELIISSKESLDNDQFDVAIQTSLKAVELDKSNVNALILLATSYAQKGSVEFKEKEYGQKAIDVIAEVLKKDPNNSEAYRVQGYAYEIMSLWPQATESYNKAIQINPQNAHAYANRGHLYDLLGIFDKARSDYEAAIKIDENEEHALFNLARIEARTGNTERAKELINKALEQSTNSGRKAEMYQVLANIELAAENYNEARLYISKSIELNDKLPVAYVTRGEITRSELAEKVFKNEPIPNFEEKIGSIAGDAAKATSIYPNQTGAIVLVGRMSVLLGEYEQAEKLFEKALTMINTDITLGISEKIIAQTEIQNYIKILKENK